MKDSNQLDVPQLVYSKLSQVLPMPLKVWLSRFFFSISPDIPYDLSKRISQINYQKPIAFGIIFGLFFYLGVTSAFAHVQGVLFPPVCASPEDYPCKGFQFFYNDYVNLIMYGIITPLTFGFGLAMLLATVLTWRDLDEYVDSPRSTMLGWKGLLITTIVLVISSLAISNYINDVANPAGAMRTSIIDEATDFWFLGHWDKTSPMSPITIFYAIINYLKLAFLLFCVAAFITAIRPILCLSKHLAEIKNGIDVDYSKRILERLSYFGDVYLFAKILLFIAMVHSVVWSYSPLAIGVNFNIERTFIVFTALFFIAIPRLHFESEWYRAALIAKEQGIEMSTKPEIIKGTKYYIIWLMDYLLMGGYIVSVTGIVNFGEFADFISKTTG